MKRISIIRAARGALAATLALIGLLLPAYSAAEQRISDITFNALPDGRLSIALDFSGGSVERVLQLHH